MELQHIIAIISDVLGMDREKITGEMFFVDDLGADSIDLIQIWMKIEEEFNLEISPNLAEQPETVQEAADLVLKLITPVTGRKKDKR